MDMVLAARFMNRMAADVAYSALHGSGIDAKIFDDFVPGFMGLATGEGGVRVMVPADQYERAAIVLQAAEANGPAATPKTLGARLAEMAPILIIPAMFVGAIVWALLRRFVFSH